VDTTVVRGNTYVYQVTAVNAAGPSAPTNTVSVTVPAIPAAPTSFRVSVVKAGGNNYTATLTWLDNATNETGFTIQRATNATFTTGLASFNAAANVMTLTQTVTRRTTYYYRIRANNAGGSSVWVNALPFPIRTGP
jgi:predicted phage tail protein